MITNKIQINLYFFITFHLLTKFKILHYFKKTYLSIENGLLAKQKFL